MGNSRNKSKAQEVKHRDVNAAQRVMVALDLWNQRLTYDEIARRAGYASSGAAYNAIQRELKRRIDPKIDEHRKQELSILDAIHQKVWAEAFGKKDNDGDDITNLWAVDRLIELSRDRRKLLNLDIHPEEEMANQNYVKRIVLMSGGADASANDG